MARDFDVRQPYLGGSEAALFNQCRRGDWSEIEIDSHPGSSGSTVGYVYLPGTPSWLSVRWRCKQPNTPGGLAPVASATPPMTPPTATTPADAATVPVAPASPVAPDVVQLKEGTIYKGTISQQVPGAYVEIVVVGGEILRLPMAAVRYAGPADRVEGVVPAPDATVLVASSGNRVAIHEITSTTTVAGLSAFDHRLVCTAPCKVGLRAGEYDLALSTGDDAPIRASRVVVPAGNSTLMASYTSRAGARTTAKIVAIMAVIAGSVLAIHGAVDKSRVCKDSSFGDPICVDEPNATEMLFGLGVMILVPLGALPFAMWKDSATIEVVPGLSPATGLRERSAPAPGEWAGASLRVRF